MKDYRFIFFLLLFYPQFTFSQGLLFEQLDVRHGLSQTTINAMYQDELNQVWIATRDGLNLYNGNKIKQFKPSVNDTTGLWGNNIHMVCGNKNGLIYIQCMSGLISYNLRTQKFQIVARHNINYITYGKDRLWIASKNKLQYYNKEQNQIRDYLNVGTDNSEKITTILESSDGKIYIGSKTSGVIIVDKNKKTSTLLDGISIVCLFEDNLKRIWVGTLRDGLFCIDSRNNIQHYRHSTDNSNSLASDFVRSICQDDFGNFWIGTMNGISVLNPENKVIHNYNHSEADPYSLSNFSVWSILKDIQGTLWIGTYSGGINLINPRITFSKFYRPTYGKNSLNSPLVSNVVEDYKGNLWIATDDAGLNYFERESNTFSHFTHLPNNPNSISSNTVKALCIDRENGCVWIGTHLGGMNKLDIDSKKITRIVLNTGNTDSDNYVRCIVKHGKKLYLGTHKSIIVYDIASGTTTKLLKNTTDINQIWDMMIDKKNRLWFSTTHEVYCFNLNTKKLSNVKYEGETSGSLNWATFYEDKSERVWIGSANYGLGVMLNTADKISFYNTTNSEIIDNYIIDISESPLGYLLIATNRGLSKFDVDNNEFSNYYNSRFFPFDAFNERCISITSSDEIVFCSLKGMLILSDRDLDYTSEELTINISDLYINNDLVYPGDNTNILKEAIAYTDRIDLKKDHSVITFEFSTSNFLRSLDPKIQYQLENFDENWIDAKHNNAVTYTNLNPGKYIFRIKGIELSTGREIPEKKITIVISPPFYAAWYAYLFYFLFFSGILYLIFSQIRMKTKLKYTDEEKRYVEEMNQSKLRFFINISHEIRTPVTILISQIETLLQTKDIPGGISFRLNKALKTAKSLKGLINELLEFRKQELGEQPLKASELDVISFIEDVFQSFKTYADSKQINLSYIYKKGYIKLWFDPRQLSKAIYNLLSNAIKFTPANGSVTLTVEESLNSVVISVIDTGCGIKKEDLDKIFNRFYQGEKQHSLDSGFGIGLALTRSIVEMHKGTISAKNNENGGSTFSISLPLGHSHLSEKEKVSDENLDETPIYTPRTDLLLPMYEEDEDINSIQNELSILIVEDDAYLLQILEDIFKPIYKHVEILSNGKDAYEKAVELVPDIILSDVMLPGISGVELCRKLKSNIETNHIPILLLTAQTNEESMLEGLIAGADDYVIKPFNTKILISRCNNLIYNRTLLQKSLRNTLDTNIVGLTTNREDQEFIDKMVNLVKANLSNIEFDINTMAKEMLLSRSSLFSKIKDLTGQTPRSYILGIRLQYSIDLLTNEPKMPISNIALEVGFIDTSHFIKLFKKEFGVTPHRYRTDYLNKKE